MADTLTANYNLVKIEVTASPDTWGNKINANMDTVDTQLKALHDLLANYVTFASGGLINGPLRSSVGVTTGDQLLTRDQVLSYITGYLPVGVIALWSGSLASIPANYHLCDGTTGTPDLRGRFVIGASSPGNAPGTVGGAVSNTPTITVDAHTLTTAEIPTHNHTLHDPQHSHGITEPNGGLGHRHQVGIFGAVTSGSTAVGPVDWTGVANAWTSYSVTGITINNASTGISIDAAGGGGAHSHTASSSAVPTVPPYYALAYIMRV